MMRGTRRTKLVITLSGVLLLLIAVLNFPSIVTITAPEGADIAVSRDKGASFESIGTSTVTHAFFGKPSAIYVSITESGKQTIGTVTLKRYSKQSISFGLANTVPAKKISDGAVTNAFFDGTRGQGIVYGQNTLVNFSTTSANTPLNPAYTRLPYLRKIIWYDVNNFVFLGDQGLGQFVNGSSQGYQNAGSRVSGIKAIGRTNTFGAPTIIDMGKADDKPLVLLSTTNIFLSQDRGTTLRGIVSFDPIERETSLFVSGDSIFKVSGPLLTDGEDSKEAAGRQQTLEEYTYGGELVKKTIINDQFEVVNVVKQDEITYILSESSIYAIDAEGIQSELTYFANPVGLTAYKDDVLLLADNGLWRLNEDGLSFELLFSYSSFGIGLPESLSVDPNNQIIFGTQPRRGEKNNSATFTLRY